MATSVTIEEFHALLNSGEKKSPLLEALRKLTTIDTPETVVSLEAAEAERWGGWHEV